MSNNNVQLLFPYLQKVSAGSRGGEGKGKEEKWSMVKEIYEGSRLQKE